MMDESSDKKPFSFGFTKKLEKQQLVEQTAISEKHIKKKEETDFVLELSGKEVKSVKPKEEPKQLVIPLIQKNNWRSERDKTQSKNGEKVLSEPKSAGDKSSGGIVDEAVEELLKEARLHKDEWDNRDATDLNLSIPLLMRNKVPEGYEEDERLDVSLRPQETSGQDYDEVPIEQFGMAMLRGMGFKEEEGIGDKMKKTVKPIEVTVRPKGQGLGADKRPVMPQKQTKRKPGDKKVEEEPVGYAKGVGVLVTSGPHKNLYGKIEGVDDDNARVVIKLALSNQSVTLSQYGVQIVDKEEYKKYAKDIGKFSKGHDELKKKKEKEDDQKRDRKKNGYDSPSEHNRKRDRDDERRHRKKHSDYDSDNRSDNERTSSSKYEYDDERTSKHKHRRDEDRHRETRRRDDDNDEYDRKRDRRKDEDRDRKDKDRQRKYKEEDSSDYDRKRDRRKDEDKQRKRDKYYEEEEEDYKYDKKEKRRKEDDHSISKPSRSWLRPDLRVRFIDKNFKKGRYYNSKVAIIDVVTMETCTCRTDEGRLLEDISQDMIETLIPKTDPGYIMVVNGKLRGQLGTILKRDKVSCQAAVQLLQDRDQIVKLSYNDICEYIGDIQANEDY